MRPSMYLSLLVASTLLACGSSGGGKSPGVLLETSMGEPDNPVEVQKRWYIETAPGEQLVLRIHWTVANDPKPDEQPFGDIKVELDTNTLGATDVSCELQDPEYAALHIDRKMWSAKLVCAYEYAKGSGDGLEATLWAPGILETR